MFFGGYSLFIARQRFLLFLCFGARQFKRPLQRSAFIKRRVSTKAQRENKAFQHAAFKKTRFRWGACPKKTLERVAGLILRALAHSIFVFIFL